MAATITRVDLQPDRTAYPTLAGLMVRSSLASTQKPGEAGRRASTMKAQRFCDDIQPVIAELRSAGLTTCEGLARGLRVRGIRKPRGGLVWTACEVRRLLRKIAE